MKKKDLETKLRAKGASLVEQGGKHEKWVSAQGYRFTVPRHTEIDENTARIILKQADL